MSTPAASRSRTFAASRAASPSNIIVVQSFMILLELARPADESPCEVTRVSTSNGTVAATSSMTQRTA